MNFEIFGKQSLLTDLATKESPFKKLHIKMPNSGCLRNVERCKFLTPVCRRNLSHLPRGLCRTSQAPLFAPRLRTTSFASPSWPCVSSTAFVLPTGTAVSSSPSLLCFRSTALCAAAAHRFLYLIMFSVLYEHCFLRRNQEPRTAALSSLS